MPLNLHDIGVDAYAMAGQKWLCGPEGTGLLYVRYDRFADISPTYARYGQADMTGYYCRRRPRTGTRLESSPGTVIAAQAATLTWLRDEVGMDWAYARVAEMGALFRGLLAEISGVEVVTPPNAMAGMVNFNVARVCILGSWRTRSMIAATPSGTSNTRRASSPPALR